MSNPKRKIEKPNNKPCTFLTLGVRSGRAFCVLAFLFLLSFESFAFPIDIVTNGNFNDGRNGFSSDYDWNDDNNGDYSIDDEPGDVNGGWYDFYDHTVGTNQGEMLIANASTSNNDDVWQMNTSAVSGQTYTLSFWYRNADNGNLSTLGWTANGSQIGSTVVAGNSWQQITVVYTATSTGTVTFAIKEFTRVSSGNVFAIDDVSILTDLPATCSGTFRDTGGNGGDYSNYEDYTNTYCASPGNNVRLNFTQFDLENGYDYLRIYDGTSVSDQLFNNYTGNNSPGTITSTAGCLTVRFTSDYSVTESGWSAGISCVADPSCSSIDQILINDLDASSDIDITGGATVYEGQLPNNWNIEGTGTGSVGSMQFQVTGDASQSNIESASPYRMPTDAVALNWGVGTYSIKVTQYSESGGGGNVCDEESFDLIIDDCAISNLSANSNSSVCTGETLNLTATGGGTGASYTWSGPNSFTSSQQNPSINNIGSAVSGNYVVTVTNSGCSATASTNVSVDVAPNVSVTTENANCGLNNGEVILSFPDRGDRTNIEFSINNGSSYNHNVSDAVGSTTIAVGPGNYDVWTRWGNNECPVDLGSVNISRESGTLNTTNSDPTVCLGESSTLGATLLNAVGSTTYSWSNGLGTGTSKTVTPNADITYSITATDNEGCTATGTIAVNVNSLPTANAGSNSPVCAGATINLTAGGGVSYSWTGPNGFSSGSQNPNVASAAMVNAGVYNLTVTDGNGCSNVDAVNIAVTSGLTVTAGVADNKICSGTALNLNAGGANSYTWSGPNGFSSNSQNPTISSPTTSSSGVYTVTGTNTNSCTATATTSVTVIDNNRTASNDGPKCVGSTINLTSSGGDSYSWAGPDGFSSTSANPSISNTALSNEGIYTVTVSITDACSETATTQLTLYGLPNVSVTDPGTICQHDDALLQASGGVSYSWAGPNSFSSSQQNPTVSNVTNAKTGIYTVTVTNASSCSASATTNLSLSFPSLVVSSDTALCSGGTINLNASGGIGYNWAGPNSFTSSSSSISIGSAGAAEAGVYTVTVNNSLGCTATTGISVTVLSTTASINTAPSICTGDSLKLEIPGWSNYSWTGPSSFSSSDTEPFIANSVTSNSGIYSVTVSVAGCTTTATSSVTVRALPTPIISSNQPVCLGTSLNLSTAAQSSYTWKGPDSFTSSGQNPVVSVNDSLVQGIYTLSVIDGFGCVDSTTHAVDVSIVYPTASNSGISCLGQNVNLFATGGSSYSWTGPNSYSSSSQNPVLSNISASVAGVYSVTITDANGCTGTATTEIVVSIPTATATHNGPVCQGENLILSGSVNDQYDWAGPNGFSSSLRIPQISNVTLAANGPYTFTVTDSVSCTATASVNVVINPLPTVTSSNNGPICQGETLNLNVSWGSSYSWAGPNGFLSSSQNPVIANAPAAANGTYTVQVTDPNSCSSIATMAVTVNPSPTPIASATIADICVGQTLNLLGSGGGDYAWTGPNSFSSSQEDPNRTNATVGMTGIYTLVVTSTPQGCTASTTLAISVNTIPDPPIVSDITRCGPGTVTITASGCSGIYSWFSSNGSSTVLGTGESFTSPSLSSDRSYFVDCTEFTCPSSTRSEVEVDILPLPTATASVTQQHCKGSTAKFTGGGNNVSSYSWSGPSGWTSPSQSPTFLVTQNSDAGAYTITTTRSNGCTATATTNLTVINNCNNICDQRYVIIPSNPSGCNNDNGQVYISATNEYETSLDGISWERGSHTFRDLGVGNYFFYVRDYATQNICKNVNNTLVSTTSSYFTGTNVTAASDCYSANGSIQLQGVQPSDDVTWLATLKGASVPVSSLSPSNTIDSLTPGLYYVKVSRVNEFCYGERYVTVPNNGTECTSDIFCDDSTVPNLFPNGDFGSGTAENGPVLTETQYGYSTYTCYSPWDGFYSIVYETDCDNNNHQAFQFTQATGWWNILREDHTPGDTQGYMMVINAGYTPNIVIEKEIGDLCPNTQYNFTAWMRNISPLSTIQPDAAFIIDGVILATSGPVSGTQWKKVGFSFKTGDNTSSALFALRNIAPGGFGNNWILDDIKVSKCPLEIELSGTTVACLGGDSEEINASIGDPYSEHTFFKWQKSDDNGVTWDEVTTVAEGTYVSGSMDVSLTLPTPIVSALSGRIYRIRLATTAGTIDDPQCSVFSALTQIIVPPIEVVVTEDQVKCIGSGDVTLEAIPSGGNAPYTFEWDNGLPANATVTVNPSISTDYIVTVRDSSGCPVTDTINVAVEDQPTLTVSVGPDSVCVDGPAGIIAHVEGGSGDFDYTWFSASDTTGIWTELVGEKDSLYSPNTSVAQEIYFRVFVEDLTFDCNDALSNAVLFHVVDDPVVSMNTTDVSLCLNGNIELIPTITGGTGQLHYQWEYSSDGNSPWTTLTNDTLETLTVPSDVVKVEYYRLTATSDGNGCDFPPSGVSRVEVLPVFDVDVSLVDNVVCIDGSVILHADTSSGSGTVTYQWSSSLDGSNFNTISGATDSIYTPVTSTEGILYYQVEATASGIGCGSATSANASVTVLPVFSVDVTVNNPLVCIGGAVELIADTTNGTGTVTYQWFESTDDVSFNAISGAIDSNYIPSTAVAGITYYRVEATASGSGCGTVVSPSVSVEVLPVFSVEIDIANSTVCVGGAVELVADTTNGTGTVTYQWLESSNNSTFTPISGETDSNFVANTATEGVMYYRVEATASGSGCGTVTSSSSIVEVLPVFDVDVTLLSNTVCIGGAVELFADTVSGSGTVTYQWFESSDNSTFTPISGETDSTYTPNTSAVGDLYYRVQATASGAGCGVVDSDNATVTVLPIFDVDVNVDNAVVCITGAVQLEADTVNGTGAVTYQWLSSTDNSSFSPISGATDSIYVPNTNTAGITYYQVQATASGPGCGNVTSASASVEVLPEYSVDISVSDNIVCQGGAAELVADTTNGTGTITYQWLSSTDLSTFTPIPGATDSNLIVNTSSVGIIYYRVNATASGPGCGTVTTRPSTVEVLPVFEVDVTLLSNTVCIGGAVELFADTTSGTGTISYQWYESSDNSTFSPISGETDSTYNPNTSAVGSLYYRVQATASGSGCGVVDSDNATVTVLPIFDVDVNVDNAVVCIGGAVQLEADTTNGTGTVTYQWLSSTDNSTFSPISGATDSVYVPNTATEGITYYQVQATADGSGCGTVTSASASVEVLPIFSVDVALASQTVCVGGAVELVADTTNGTGTITYQWFESSDNSTFTLMSGETDSNLVVNTAAVGINYYRVDATASGSGCGTVSSSPATVEVLPVFEVDVSLDDNIVCEDGLVILQSDTTSGTGTVTYQWFSSADGSSFSPIADSTDAILYPSTSSVDTLYYRLEATASGVGCGMAESDIASVAVLPQLSIDVVPDNAEVCLGSPVTFEGNPQNGVGNISYQWQAYNGVTWQNIGGETDSVYSPATNVAGQYLYRINSFADGVGCTDASSAAATLTVNEYPDVTVSNADPLCVPNNGQISFSFSDETYQDSVQFSIDGGLTYPYITYDSLLSYSIDTLSAGSYAIFARWGDNSCPIDLGTVDLEERPAPAASVSFVDPTCTTDNGQITFTFADESTRTQLEFSLDGGVTYETAVNDNLGTVTYSNLAPDTYDLWVRWENNECPIDLADVTLTDHPGPELTVSADTTICFGATALLTANSTGGDEPIIFSWNNSLPDGSSHTVSPASTTSFIVVATDTNGCTSEDTILITVNPLPVISMTGGEYCEGDSAFLTVSGGNTYQWSGPNGFSDSNQNPSMGNVDTTNSGFYIVQVADLNSCQTIDSVEVIVHPAPDAPIVTGANRCGPGVLTLTASGCSGTITWFNNQFSNSVVGFGTTFETISLVASANYFASCTSSNNCESFTRSLAVAEIREASNAEVITVNSTCVGEVPLDNGILIATGFREGETYSFSEGSTFNAATAIPATPTVIPSNGRMYETIDNPTGVTTYYTVRIISLDGCPTDHTVEFERQCDDCLPFCEPASINKVK